MEFNVEKFDPVHHIGLYQFPDSICDGLMEWYDEADNKSAGNTQDAVKNDKLTIKKSTDVTVQRPERSHPAIANYLDCLNSVLQDYYNMFPSSGGPGAWKLDIVENFNIQRYQPGEGFFQWHYERQPQKPSCDRVLVFMTYLNDVEEAGTHFMYQNTTTECRKGLTVIWPADWTYTHKGQISKEHEKTIITGWISYTGEVNELPRDNTSNQ